MIKNYKKYIKENIDYPINKINFILDNIYPEIKYQIFNLTSEKNDIQKAIYELSKNNKQAFEDVYKKIVNMSYFYHQESLNENYKENINSIEDVFNIPYTYVDRCFDLLLDIICEEKGISEKSFNDIDKTKSYLESFFDNNKEILLEIDKFSNSNKRSKYCAEFLYDKYFNN